VDGLRDRALSGEDAGRGTYAADHVDGGAGKPDSAGVGETGHVPRARIAISGPGAIEFSCMTSRPGGRSVLSI